MGRPTTKEDLIHAAEANFEKIWQIIEAMPVEMRHAQFAFDDRDRNLRDILIHLYEWHQLLLNWIAANQNGMAQPFLPVPYNWKTYPQMNIAFWEKHQGTPHSDAVAMLKQSHSDVMAVIDTFSNEELFTKKYFPWTGTTSLGSYCVSSTSSHYDWAIKKMKKHIASCLK